MKKSLLPLFLLLTAASAQEPTRVAVLAFDTDAAATPYRLGLATGLQRALNVIDNLYAPPVGDTLVVAQGTPEAELDTAVFAEAFGAQALVSGLVTTTEGGGAQVSVFLAETGQEPRQVPVEGTLADTQGLVSAVLETVIQELELPLTPEDRAELEAVIAQTPTLSELGAVGEAALGLGGTDSPELAAAAEAGSAWALAERAEVLGAAGNDDEALALAEQAVQTLPEDAETLVARGVVQAAAGDVPAAQAAFTAALAVNPAHAVALAGRARLSGDAAAATRDLEAALAAYPRYAAAYLELSTLQRGAGNDATALQTLRTGATRVPESAGLASAFIAEAVRAGNTAEAVTFLETALNAPDPAPSLYALAASLPAEQGERALTILREGRAAYPEDAALALAESEMLRKTGDFAGAETVLRDAQAFAPNNPELANQLALAQAQQGKTDEAAATLSAAAEQNPELGDLLSRNLAEVYFQAGDNEAALETLRPLLADNPDDSGLYTFYGAALGRSGDYEGALQALEQALELNPDNLEAEQTRAFVSQTQLLVEAVTEPPTGEAGTALREGLTALETGALDAAQTAFDRAAELAPGGLPSFYQGFIRQRRGDLRGAVEAYTASLDSFPEPSPGQATVLNNAGFAYFRLGRYDRAVELLEQAVAADPESSEAQLNLGLIYYDLGRFEDALAPLEAALAGNPGLAQTTVNTGAEEPVTFTALLEEVRGAE